MEIDGQIQIGFICYRVPLGTNKFVSHQLKRKCQEIKDNSTKMVEVLSGERQALWSMLRLSFMARFEYFGQLTPPSLS